MSRIPASSSGDGVDLGALVEVRLSGLLRCRNQEEFDVVRHHLAAHVELTLAEPGCLAFAVSPQESSLDWIVEERFEHPSAFLVHQARVASGEWGRATRGIAREHTVTGMPQR